jgi:hypothetical protein
LNEAAQGRYEPIMALQSASSTIGGQIMHGMQLSVICTEDAGELKADLPIGAARRRMITVLQAHAASGRGRDRRFPTGPAQCRY